MITKAQAGTLIGRDMVDQDGDRIGSIGQVWADGEGEPTWASVRTGLFGRHESLVPLPDAHLADDRLAVPFSKAQVKDAPQVDIAHDEPLTRDEVDLLYRHYGMGWPDAGQPGAAAGTTTARDATAGSSTDKAMTRSEERLSVGTERQPVARARLRKYVVTELQQVTVPVRREEVRLERVPVTDDEPAEPTDGTELAESEHELVLHAERPVVATETVPVERVRLRKDTVTEPRTVSGEVRKEQIEADLPDDAPGPH